MTARIVDAVWYRLTPFTIISTAAFATTSKHYYFPATLGPWYCNDYQQIPNRTSRPGIVVIIFVILSFSVFCGGNFDRA